MKDIPEGKLVIIVTLYNIFILSKAKLRHQIQQSNRGEQVTRHE